MLPQQLLVSQQFHQSQGLNFSGLDYCRRYQNLPQNIESVIYFERIWYNSFFFDIADCAFEGPSFHNSRYLPSLYNGKVVQRYFLIGQISPICLRATQCVLLEARHG
jgi:hypothetical protein